jgi:iron complex outermembrane recepter protein
MISSKKILGIAIGLAAPIGVANAAMQLEEIVVTAQKRSESMQDVPIAISAFSANELAKSGIKSYDDLGLVTPGLTSSRQVGAAVPYLRGVGAQSTSVGVESATAMYLDGVYVSGTVDGIMSLNNIERIEVLKGPQGTLFGRNTTGGVISVITKDPTFESQAHVSAGFGNYDMTSGGFYGSTGLSDNIAVDLSVVARRQNEGFGKNFVNGDEVGFEEYTSVRTKLLWEITNDTTAKLSARWNENDDDIGVIRSCVNAEFGCVGFSQPLSNLNDVEADSTGFSERESMAFSARVDSAFDFMDFVSITSYKDSESLQFFDFDSSFLPAATAALNQDDQTFTQEFQFLSNDNSKDYSWIVGLYYYNDEWSYTPLRVAQPLSPAYPGSPIGVAVNADDTVDTESYSAFGEFKYDITLDTSLTLGARWTNDDRELYGQTIIENPINTVFMTIPFEASDSWSEMTYRAVLNHNFTDDVLGYISYNRGFKSGAFDSVVFNGIAPEPVEPEILDAYEIGAKGEYFDGLVRLNTALFFYDYSNIQLQKIDGSGSGAANSILLNAAESEIWGLEMDGQALLGEYFTARFGLAYLDSEYTDFAGCVINTPSGSVAPTGTPGNIRTDGDCSGNDLVRSPELTYNIGLVFDMPTDSGIYGASIMAAYNDGFFWEPDNLHAEADYTVVNAELSWLTSDEKFGITLWGKNITDEEYSVYTTAASSGTVGAGAPPATFGITLDYHME